MMITFLTLSTWKWCRLSSILVIQIFPLINIWWSLWRRIQKDLVREFISLEKGLCQLPFFIHQLFWCENCLHIFIFSFLLEENTYHRKALMTILIWFFYIASDKYIRNRKKLYAYACIPLAKPFFDCL